MKERTVDEIVSTLKTLSKFEQTFDLFFNDAANILEFEHKRFLAMKKENDDLRAQLEALQPAPPRIPPNGSKLFVWGNGWDKSSRIRAISAGRMTEHGCVVCYSQGKNEWTTEDTTYWQNWEEVE